MVQRKGAHFVYSDWRWDASTTRMMKDINWKPLEHKRKVDSVVLLHDIREVTDADPTTKTASKPTLNMFSFVNIQGLCPQTKPSSLPYLKDLTNCSKQLFLALTETWLTDNHKKGELEIEN